MRKRFWFRKILANVMVIVLAVFTTLSIVLPVIEFEKEMDRQNFPESYKPYLRQLKKEFPKWKFEAFHTGLTWDEVIDGESVLGYNLVQNNVDSVPSSWKSIDEGAFDWVNNDWIPFSGDEYVQASESIISYFMDPRNFLNSENIFQFELLSYSESQTVSGVNAILKKSFMCNKEISRDMTYADAFVEIGKKHGISPYLLAARVLQEQGPLGKSELISGSISGFEGYYNYFNIKAAGTTREEVVNNGLTKAKEEGWDSIYKSLEGGALFLGENYINKGQDVFYLQKFDVESEFEGMYWHQYMQAVYGAFNEGNRVGRAYDEMGIKNQSFVFKIPVYKDMPSVACEKPFVDGNPNYKLSSLSVSGYKLTPEFNPDIFEYSVEIPEGVNNVYVTVDTFSSATGYKGVGNIDLSKINNQICIYVEAENGLNTQYVVNVSN